MHDLSKAIAKEDSGEGLRASLFWSAALFALKYEYNGWTAPLRHATRIPPTLDDLYQSSRDGWTHLLHAVAIQAVFLLLIAPVVEESLTRGLPILLVKRLGSKWSFARTVWFVWAVAAAATSAFTLGHLPRTVADAAPHFVFGLVAWRIAFGYGLKYSILLHSLSNLLWLIFSILIVCKVV